MNVHFNPYVAPEKNVVGSVVLFDKISGNIIYVLPDDLISYNSTLYTPIGVVVIPVSHDVYGTGECGIMSLMSMDCDNPEKGNTTIFSSMRWGGDSTDLSLSNLTQVPVISTALTSNEITGVTGSGYLPSTKFSGNTPSVGSGLDTLAGYDSNYTGGTIPSPYLEDGSRNPSYYSTDTSKYPGLSANCLSDFDGVGNTAVITAAATAQTDWKTASAITNNSSAGYYPAACCCYRFNPDGNSAGKWYLPAMGELGYMVARFNEIQNSLIKIKNQFGSSFVCLLNSTDSYWGSSEWSYNGAYNVDMFIGKVYFINKASSSGVRAFFRA